MCIRDRYWIDVTVRSPYAERYNAGTSTTAATVCGAAASKGAVEKRQKYESELVIPVAYEPYGRLAGESIKCLEGIAINAAAVSEQRWAGTHLLQRWLRQMQRAVIWAAADVDLAALGKAATAAEAAIAKNAIMRVCRTPHRFDATQVGLDRSVGPRSNA